MLNQLQGTLDDAANSNNEDWDIVLATVANTIISFCDRLIATITKQTSTEKGFGPAIIDDQVKSHTNDSFVAKKVTKAMETPKRAGLPHTEK